MRARRRPAEFEDVRSDGGLASLSDHRENVGGWRLCERVGRGGGASVWRAVDGAGNVAALKIPHASAREWVTHEHRLLVQLAHPNIVAAWGVTESHERAALVLEYLPHGDLVALAGGPARHWLDALAAVLGAVRHLHTQGLAHCDLKARNVLFAGDGNPRLIDFAGARPLDARLRRGAATVECVPAGIAACGRDADCFAFAALTYELVTGRLPYGGAGQRWPGESPRAAVAPDRALAPLLATAVDVLCAGGSPRDGLAALGDDIEFATAAYR